MTPWQHIAGYTQIARENFSHSLQQCNQVQQYTLKRILARNAATKFGKRYGFDRIDDMDRFRAQVPVHRYEDLAKQIEDMTRGRRQTLCAGDILAFEKTGGSSGAHKLIPYTSDSLTDFQAALYPWLADLLAARPSIEKGCAYWAISPVVRTENRVEDGTPLGLSDAAYFGELAQDFDVLSAVSPVVAKAGDMDLWRRQTLLQLLAREDLSLISVWSPTFILSLVEHLHELGPALLPDLPRKRAHSVRRALAGNRLDTELLWPLLDTISCWTHGRSAAFVPQLQALFPHAQIQGKGLLLTEGAISVPQADYSRPVLAVNSGFFEFLDTSGRSHLAHEVNEDQIYRVILTNHSGLYRYDTGDLTRVHGWAGNTPQLEFVGRNGLVSDLCGEKLTEGFVATCLPGDGGFAMLAPSLTGTPHYVLFIDPKDSSSDIGITIAQQVDRKLCRNPQYRYARQLGQLSKLRTCLVDRPLQKYASYGLQMGQRLGDIKPVALRPETDWEQHFNGVSA